jgi:hypothetical protein
MTLPVLHLSYNPKGTLKMNPTIGETGAMLIHPVEKKHSCGHHGESTPMCHYGQIRHKKTAIPEISRNSCLIKVFPVVNYPASSTALLITFRG